MIWQLKARENAPKDAIQFLSARGMQPYLRLRESVEKIFGKYTYEAAQKLGAQLSPYALDDQLVKKLTREGLQLEGDGVVPFASPALGLDPVWLARANEKTFTVWEIRDFLERESLTPTVLYLAEESIQVLSRVSLPIRDLWRALECIDALECHRNPVLSISCRRHS